MEEPVVWLKLNNNFNCMRWDISEGFYCVTTITQLDPFHTTYTHLYLRLPLHPLPIKYPITSILKL
jgi:hypothetical protein